MAEATLSHLRTAGAVVHVEGSGRAVERFARRLRRLDGAPRIVVGPPRSAGPAPGPMCLFTRPFWAGRGGSGPRVTLHVDGRLVWEFVGVRRSHLPDPAAVVERSRRLRPFRSRLAPVRLAPTDRAA